jgi:hypothetical protein
MDIKSGLKFQFFNQNIVPDRIIKYTYLNIIYFYKKLFILQDEISTDFTKYGEGKGNLSLKIEENTGRKAHTN